LIKSDKYFAFDYNMDGIGWSAFGSGCTTAAHIDGVHMTHTNEEAESNLGIENFFADKSQS
jgi:hypothetical protein